jgi:hypothetical protein
MEIRMAGCVLASLVAQIPKAAEAQPAVPAAPAIEAGVRVAA